MITEFLPFFVDESDHLLGTLAGGPDIEQGHGQGIVLQDQHNGLYLVMQGSIVKIPEDTDHFPIPLGRSIQVDPELPAFAQGLLAPTEFIGGHLVDDESLANVSAHGTVIMAALYDLNPQQVCIVIINPVQVHRLVMQFTAFSLDALHNDAYIASGI